MQIKQPLLTYIVTNDKFVHILCIIAIILNFILLSAKN